MTRDGRPGGTGGGSGPEQGGAGEPSPPAAVVVDEGEAHATVTLKHPPVNVLTLPVIRRFREALETLGERRELSAVVVKGTRETGFSAGVDVAAHRPGTVDEMLGSFHRLIRSLWTLPQVTIAAIHGRALGGGLELAAACDLVLASRDSRLGQPEIKLACFPPVAAALLPGRIGHHRAAELLLLGREIDAGTAAAWGLVNTVVEPDVLEREVERVLADLRGLSREALRVTCQALRGRREEWERRLAETEEIYRRRLTGTEDMAEGVRAFEERRPPRWKHR